MGSEGSVGSVGSAVLVGFLDLGFVGSGYWVLAPEYGSEGAIWAYFSSQLQGPWIRVRILGRVLDSKGG